MAVTEVAKWQNRIIAAREVSVEDILFNPNNWRLHPKEQQEALTGILEQVGWVQHVIINETTGNLIDGHLRAQLAAKHGESTLPATIVRLSQEEEDLVLASLDPLGSLAVADRKKQGELLARVEAEDEHLQALLDELGGGPNMPEITYDSIDTLPDMENFEEPATSLRLIVQVDNLEQFALLRERLGLPLTGQGERIRYHFRDCKAVIHVHPGIEA